MLHAKVWSAVMEVSALGIFWKYLDRKVEGELEGGGVVIVA